jgi:4'-phosphopantetheinyl transferase
VEREKIMPLLLNQNIDSGVIGLWKISEEPEELWSLAKLTEPDTAAFSQITTLHRKKEWLATRALLCELIKIPCQINYHQDGRPFLGNETTNISISHTTGYVAIFLHDHAYPGIDIELISRKVGKVASRFLSSDELMYCSDNSGFSDRLLLLHWCAKEAIFKMMPLSKIDFSADIRISINDSDSDSRSIQGMFNDKSGQIPIYLSYLVENGVIMVWGSIDETKLSS